MLLNDGKDVKSNKTVIPSETFEILTSAQAIVLGKPPYPEFSVSGYGLGLGRSSYQGYEV